MGRMSISTLDSTVTLEGLLDSWCARSDDLSLGSRHREAWQKGLVVEHFGGDRPAGSITREELLEFRDLVEEVYAASSSRIVFAFLLRSLERGVESGAVSGHVIQGLVRSNRKEGSR